jgi:hypothetical protein
MLSRKRGSPADLPDRTSKWKALARLTMKEFTTDSNAAMRGTRCRSEVGFWRDVRGTWRQVCGDFERSGVSVEWHDFETSRTLDWSKSFHADSLEICLNLAGDASISHRARFEWKERENSS